MPPPKTDPEILDEIEKLQRLKPHIRPHSVFGDSHHEAIDAEIDVLTNRLTLDELHQRYETAAQNVLEHALFAHDWMTGTLDAEFLDPSDDWTSLIDTPVAAGDAA